MLDTSPSAPNLSERPASHKKKLIEVALPLQAINKAAAREKSIRFGHPSTLHLWWARRPLAICRAVLFASLIDDPSSNPHEFPTLEGQEQERKRLFDLIEQLVQWESSLNEHVLARARDEIRKSVGSELPTVYDPFCGGGAIPLEAQRLGLPTMASDLNPVAVLVTKALTEIPWRFKGYAPVHTSLREPLQSRTWERAAGLAADVAAYGKWMVQKARERIEQFYPTVRLSDGSDATVIAWLWARAVRCANPLCGALIPLIKSFVLSSKKGDEWCIDPVVDREQRLVTFETRAGTPSRDGTISRRGAVCVVCNEPVNLAYIRSEGKAGRIDTQMIAIVADSRRGRVYLPPNKEHDSIARSAQPNWAPDSDLVYNPRHMSPPLYGMTKHRDLFTSRQLLALTTFSDLVRECRKLVLEDAIAAGLEDDGKSLESGGSAATAYADAIATYLALGVDRLSDSCNALCSWKPSQTQIIHLFVRNAIGMIWDFAEPNVFGGAAGDYSVSLANLCRALALVPASEKAHVFQRDARSADFQSVQVISTDPPYYDNVPYADLSDFFYVWLRASLGTCYPELLSSLLVPKTTELVADPSRFGDNNERARSFFEEGLGEAFRSVRASTLADVPTTVYYAFKQVESDEERDGEGDILGRASVGWEAMLNALLSANFEIVGTWPMSSELANRTRGQNSNALASSIVFVCRPRTGIAARCTRVDFLRALRAELPNAVRRLRNASLAATDLEQAAIGPGMAVYSRYREVLESDGKSMTIRSALALINQELAQIVLGDIAEVDAETHFALAWFAGHFYEEAKYGEAEVLLKAKNASLDALKESGALRADRGIVQLVRPHDIVVGDIAFDGRIRARPAWAHVMCLIQALLGESGGEEVAAGILRDIGPGEAERLKDIAYHCYLICDRAKRSTEAQDFNTLVAAWPDIQKRATEGTTEPIEERLL